MEQFERFRVNPSQEMFTEWATIVENIKEVERMPPSERVALLQAHKRQFSHWAIQTLVTKTATVFATHVETLYRSIWLFNREKIMPYLRLKSEGFEVDERSLSPAGVAAVAKKLRAWYGDTPISAEDAEFLKIAQRISGKGRE